MQRRHLTLMGLLRRYVRDHPNVGDGWQVELAVTIRRYSDWLGRPAQTSDLQCSRVLSWLADLRTAGRAAHTINNRRTGLLALWRYAAASGLVKPPNRPIPKMREPARLPVAWTLEEFSRILGACSALTERWGGFPAAAFWRAGLLVLWDSGCRLAVLRSARVCQVQVDRGLFLSSAEQQKDRRDRLYRLHAETCAAIAATLPRPPGELLFPYPRNPRELWRDFKLLVARAGLPTDRSRMFHCIRRTAESYAAQAKGIEWAAAAIGHSPEVARRFYVSPLIAPGPSLVDALPRPKL